jgi:hypothetical protein
MSEPVYEVVSPLGRLVPQDTVAAGRPVGELAGQRLAFVWGQVYRGDEMFAAIEEELRARYPEMTFVGHGVFGSIHRPPRVRESLAALPARLAEQEVSAAVVGVGA